MRLFTLVLQNAMMSQHRGGVMRGRMGPMAPAAAGGAPAMSDLLCTSRMIAGRMAGSAETNAIVRGVSESSDLVVNHIILVATDV
jgi:hypothetical protein